MQLSMRRGVSSLQRVEARHTCGQSQPRHRNASTTSENAADDCRRLGYQKSELAVDAHFQFAAGLLELQGTP